MNKKDRICLYGARLNRFGVRILIFIGMLALYSLVTGATADDAGMFLYGLIVLIGLAGLIVYGWFKSRKKREINRSHQLAAEVIVLYPSASSEEKQSLYAQRRSREMRLEALLYLFLAVLAALWFWGLYAVDAFPFSWIWGLTVILPILLLISAVLLLLSFFRRTKEEPFPVVSEQELRTAQVKLYQRHIQTGNGEHTTVSLFMEKEAITAEEYIRHEKKEAPGNIFVLGLAVGFFLILPLALLVVDIWAVSIGKAPKWSLLMFSIIAFACVILWVFVSLLSDGKDSFILSVVRYIHLKSKKSRVFCDSIQSYGEDERSPYIVFSQTGTVRILCDPEFFHRYFTVPKQEAIILMYKDRIESVTLLPCREENTPDAVSPGNAPENDILLSDEALHQAALRAIEQMSPSRKKEMEAEISYMLDGAELMKKKNLSEMTSEEDSRITSWISYDVSRSTADPDLEVVESAVMDALKVTREEIMHMKKNPFVPSLRRKLITAAAIGIGGIVITAAAAKWTGLDLSFVYLIFSAVSAVLALSCAQQIINAMRFRKLQKAYNDPKYRQKVLDAAVYREIRDQVKLSREKQ